MAWIRKRLGLGRPDNAEQTLLASAEEDKDDLRGRLERLERAEVVRARQDLKRRAFD